MTTAITHRDNELARIPIVTIQDVLMARLLARQEATRLGFSPQALVHIATAVSEITRNVVQHSQATGHLSLSETRDGDRLGLKLTVDDCGSGISNLEHVLAGISPGAGIPGSRKLMDFFEIHSGSSGTTVVMVKWLQA